MSNFMVKLQTFFRRRSVKNSIPFLLLIVGGSFGLKQFSNIKFQFGNRGTYITPEEAEKHGVKMKKYGEVTLESEYEKVKKLDIDHWEQVRGPRPWEENFNDGKDGK